MAERISVVHSESSSLGSSPVLWIERSGFKSWPGSLWCDPEADKCPIPGVSLHAPDIRFKRRLLVPFDSGNQPICLTLFLPGHTAVKIP